MKAIISTISLFLFSFSPGLAVNLAAIFGDHMVLQQNSETVIWGWGKSMEEITATSSWSSELKTTVANADAEWRVTLKTPAAGGLYTLTVQG